MFVSNYVLVGPSGNHSANPEFEHARSRYLSNRPVHVCVCVCAYRPSRRPLLRRSDPASAFLFFRGSMACISEWNLQAADCTCSEVR